MTSSQTSPSGDSFDSTSTITMKTDNGSIVEIQKEEFMKVYDRFDDGFLNSPIFPQTKPAPVDSTGTHARDSAKKQEKATSKLAASSSGSESSKKNERTANQTLKTNEDATSSARSEPLASVPEDDQLLVMMTQKDVQDASIPGDAAASKPVTK